jgi:hypothetical protein
MKPASDPSTPSRSHSRLNSMRCRRHITGNSLADGGGRRLLPVTGLAVSATVIINAPSKAIFAVLADPIKHAAIDRTGWVRKPLDSQPLTAAGQVFRTAMYHANHPDGNYQMANRVQVLDPPRAISREPGQEAGDGSLRSGGWIWRYDLAPAAPSGTRVTLSYDWSAVPGQHIGSPRSLRIICATHWPTSPGWSPRDRAAGPSGPGMPSGLARPARQALAAAGYVTLEQLTQVTEADLAGCTVLGPRRSPSSATPSPQPGLASPPRTDPGSAFCFQAVL